MKLDLGGALAAANPLSFLGTAMAGGIEMYGIHQAGQAAAADRQSGWNTNLLNAWMQGQNNALNERLMRESWAREDKAVQRRVADLKAAGLSPVLAAGSAAQSSGPVQAIAPRAENVSNRLQQSQQVLGMLTNVAQTITGALAGYHQVRLANAQATTAEAKSALAEAFADSELEEMRQRTSQSKTSTWREGLEAEYMRDNKRKMPQEDSLQGLLKQVIDAFLPEDSKRPPWDPGLHNLKKDFGDPAEAFDRMEKGYADWWNRAFKKDKDKDKKK